MEYLYWTGSTRSGLCDRLIDLVIMVAHSRSLNLKLLMVWKEQPVNEHQEKVWNPIRKDDYKYQNLIKYFTMPKDIIVVENVREYIQKSVVIDKYLGGMYSPHTFYDGLSNKQYSFDALIDNYNNILREITPTAELLSLFEKFPLPKQVISVHLRRTDKVIEAGRGDADHGINILNMEKLDSLTLQTLDRILLSNPDLKIYFCSDDFKVRKVFEEMEKYSSRVYSYIHPESEPDFSRTYVDMYIMMMSEYVILSQHHSSFSLFSSLVGGGNLIYFYDDDIIRDAKYWKFENVIYYENLSDRLNSS